MNVEGICNASYEEGMEEDKYVISYDFCANNDYKKILPNERMATDKDAYLIILEKNDNAKFYQSVLTKFNNVISFRVASDCSEVEVVLRKVKLETAEYEKAHCNESHLIHPQETIHIEGSYFFRELPSFIVNVDGFIKTLIINNCDEIVFLNSLYSIKIIL